ncbi:MAG: tetraacyldisaccharide 4'-kinase, partial [Desulfovibrionaceae bacterium]|nr:tetraacyldisaccharide 4'-kinase [Desulfovibrionaceae bacterium]
MKAATRSGGSMTLLALQSLLRPLLFPASLLYAGFMRLRRRLWELHVLKSFTPSRPCIAVGNIALGGSGKT